MLVGWSVAAVAGLVLLWLVTRTVQVIPQASAAVVERYGRFTRVLHAGLHLVVPFADTIRIRIDLREQVVPFPPQPVITRDDLVANVDTVVSYQVTDPRRATYEVAGCIQAIEQLTVTTLRDVFGSMDLERALTARQEISAALFRALDETTGKWGIHVTRVELKAIEPPTSIQDSMEKQMLVRHPPLRRDDPDRVGRYRLTARLGEGGMGTVYLGVSPGARRVAVKVVREELAQDPSFRRRFAREVDAVRRVGGFHTAPVVDAGTDDARPWLVTEYIPGPSLHEVLRTLPADLSAVVGDCLRQDPAGRPAPAEILQRLSRSGERAPGDWLPGAVRTLVARHQAATVLAPGA
ncbi:SPFH domain-containing protein [Streptomyces sp. NPDC086023]|uniref:SPFH domain-containing protein n=1 Tax=Streptomyces sp. NPDC086023 TaxID=3365746 RepID=UPI0037D680AE